MISQALEYITLTQGDIVVSRAENIVLKTLLGSCIAVCMFDEDAHVGGMNHYLLPGREYGTFRSQNTLYGATAIDKLYRCLIEQGAHKSHIVCKAFGGASVLSTSMDIGLKNINFTKRYLQAIQVELINYSFGGKQARSIKFYPTRGLVLQSTI